MGRSLSQLRTLIQRYHQGLLDCPDAHIDRSLGLNTGAAEGALNYGDLLVGYGNHRVEHGDLAYGIIRTAFRRLEPYRWKSLFDIGCGYGRILFYGALLLDRQCHGMELVQNRVSEAQRVRNAIGLENLSVRQGDVMREDWPDADCYFLMNSVLPEYLPKLAKRVDRLARDKPLLLVSHSTANRPLGRLSSLEEIALDPAEGPRGLKTFRSIAMDERG